MQSCFHRLRLVVRQDDWGRVSLVWEYRCCVSNHHTLKGDPVRHEGTGEHVVKKVGLANAFVGGFSLDVPQSSEGFVNLRIDFGG